MSRKELRVDYVVAAENPGRQARSIPVRQQGIRSNRGVTFNLELTCFSRQLYTAAREKPASTSLRLVTVLDVLFKTHALAGAESRNLLARIPG